jgi:ADP-heptose:LPS heptosyltransferase
VALARDAARGLAARGYRVVVTGSSTEVELTAAVAACTPGAIDLGGQLSIAQLTAVIAGADAIVCGNTGPGHIAAAVQTPVVCLFAPVVPARQWAPWHVPSVVLGDQHVACAGCRSTVCPHDEQSCVAAVTPAQVVDAIQLLTHRDTTFQSGTDSGTAFDAARVLGGAA